MPPTFRAPGQPGERERRQVYEARRRRDQPWRRLYKTARWSAIRRAKLASDPLCERCDERGEVVPATVVHHLVPHRGDPVIFYSGPFQSLCKPCHDSEAQAEERAADQAGGC